MKTSMTSTMLSSWIQSSSRCSGKRTVCGRSWPSTYRSIDHARWSDWACDRDGAKKSSHGLGRQRRLKPGRSRQPRGAECQAQGLRPPHLVQLTFAPLLVAGPSDRLIAVSATWTRAGDGDNRCRAAACWHLRPRGQMANRLWRRKHTGCRRRNSAPHRHSAHVRGRWPAHEPGAPAPTRSRPPVRTFPWLVTDDQALALSSAARCRPAVAGSRRAGCSRTRPTGRPRRGGPSQSA